MPAEDAQLQQLVATCGYRWKAIAGMWKGRRRSASAVKHRWNELSTLVESASAASATGSSCASVSAQHPQTQEEWEDARLVVQMVRYYVAHGPLAEQPTPANCKVAPYVLLRTLPWKELTGSLRTDWCGRPWARVAYRLIRRDAQAKAPELERNLQPRHVELVSALRLEEATAPYGLLYCELPRARRLLVSHWRRTGEATSKEQVEAKLESGWQIELALRDQLELVRYADGGPHHKATPIPCLLASGFRRAVVGGPAAGGVHYAAPEHTMAWMGLLGGGSRRRGTMARARACFKYQRHLAQAAGDAIALQVAISAVASAFGALGTEPRGPLRYVSLYSGAFDVFLRALRWVQEHSWPRASVVPIMAAERRSSRRRLLQAEESYVHVVRSAARAAATKLGEVDLLTASPECPPLSKGRLLGGASATVRQAKAKRAIRRFACVMTKAIRNMQPRVIIIEQVTGIATHYPGLLRMLMRKLRAADKAYAWMGRKVDAAEMGASHHRERLILVAVRWKAWAPPQQATATVTATTGGSDDAALASERRAGAAADRASRGAARSARAQRVTEQT